MFGNDGVIQKKRQLASTNLPVNVEIGFSIRPSSALEKKWGNIIQFTTGKACCGYGTRVPSVFFYPNSRKLIFVSGRVTNGNFGSSGWHCKDALLTLSPNRDYQVKMVLQQKYINVYVNGQAACSHVPRGSVKPLKNVKVYMSNPWNAPAKATVKDFYLKELSAPAQSNIALSFSCVFVYLCIKIAVFLFLFLLFYFHPFLLVEIFYVQKLAEAPPKARDASFRSFTRVRSTTRVPRWTTTTNHGAPPKVSTIANGGVATVVQVLHDNRMMEFLVIVVAFCT